MLSEVLLKLLVGLARTKTIYQNHYVMKYAINVRLLYIKYKATSTSVCIIFVHHFSLLQK